MRYINLIIYIYLLTDLLADRLSLSFGNSQVSVLAILAQYRSVSDRQTDRRTSYTAESALYAIASCRNKDSF